MDKIDATIRGTCPYAGVINRDAVGAISGHFIKLRQPITAVDWYKYNVDQRKKKPDKST